jgi:hypothetical protein
MRVTILRRAGLAIFAAFSLSSCSEIIGSLITGAVLEGLSPFLAPLIYILSFTSYAPGAETGYSLRTVMTQGQREIYSADVTLPSGYTFNGFDKWGAGARIGAYGFDFADDDSIDRYLPIYGVSHGLAYVDSNLNGTYESEIEPRIEYMPSGGSNTWLLITAPYGGDANQTTGAARFTSNIFAGFRTGILTNPTMTGTHVIESTFTSIDPDNDNADDGSGDAPIVINAMTNITIRGDDLFASTLPLTRNLDFDTISTHFGSIFNAGTTPAMNCKISLSTPLPAHLTYTPTDPATNLPNGPSNTPVDIAPGTSQSFIIGLTAQKEFLGITQRPFPDGQVEFNYQCDDNRSASTFPGINTLVLSYANTPQTDIIPIIAEPTNTGIFTIDPMSRTGAFAAAAINIGAADPHITIRPRLSMEYNMITLSICDTTNQPGGACINPPTSQIMMPYGANTINTYTVFAIADPDQAAIPLDALNNRIFLDYTDDNGTLRGSTSIALKFEVTF